MKPAPTGDYAARCKAGAEADGLPFIAALVGTSQGVPDYVHLVREFMKVTAPKAPTAAAAVEAPAPPPTATPAIVIPDQLRRDDLRFIKVRAGGKDALEKAWPTVANYSHNDPAIAIHTANGGNFGLFPASGSRLLIIDADDLARLDDLDALAGSPATFTIASGSSTPDAPKRHFYFEIEGEPLEGKRPFYDPATAGPDGHIGDLFAQGATGRGYVVGPGSIHPCGEPYTVISDLPIATLPREAWDRFAAAVRWSTTPATKPAQPRTVARGGSLGDLIGLKVTDVWPIPADAERSGDEVRFAHPTHGSTTGKNVGYNRQKDLWHCHRCGSGGDALAALAVDEGIIDCSEAGPGALNDPDVMRRVVDAAAARGFDVERAERQRRATAAPARVKTMVPPAAAPTDAETEEAFARRCVNFNPTDVGNGYRFAERFADEVMYCRPRKMWYAWDNTRWAPDHIGAVREMAKAAALGINREAAIEPNDTRRREMQKWARVSEADGRLSAMLAMASTDPRIAVMPEALDADGNLFNLRNGTLELDTLTFRPHRKEDRCTMIAGVEYDPAATCPLWLAHLRLVFGGDEEMITGLQEFFGYCMLSGNPLALFHIWYGSGENGKSVTLSTISKVFGDYAYHADASTFMDTNRDGGARPEVLAMRGARIVTAAESGRGKRLDEGLIKQHTGGDPVTVRGLYQAPETFIPEYTPILATNHNPVIRGVEHAIWRRIKRYPFTTTIPDEKKILNYERRLATEGPGILQWMINGLRQFYANGNRITTPTATEESTQAYRASMDTLAPFIVEWCVTDEPTARCDRTDLSLKYNEWRIANGEEEMAARDLYKAIEDRGWEQRRSSSSRYFVGIRVKTEDEHKAYLAAVDERDASYQKTLGGSHP